LISLKVRQITSKCQQQPGVFDDVELEATVPGRLRQQPTTGNGNIDVLGANLAILGCSCGRNHLVTLLPSYSRGRKSRVCRWKLGISVFHNYFRFWRPYRYFRLSVAVANICRHFFELYMVVDPRYAIRISTLSDTVSEISGFGGHFRLPVICGSAQGHPLRARVVENLK